MLFWPRTKERCVAAMARANSAVAPSLCSQRMNRTCAMSRIASTCSPQPAMSALSKASDARAHSPFS